MEEPAAFIRNFINDLDTALGRLKLNAQLSVKVTLSSARLKVRAHGKKRFVIALKYEGESKYRYLAATDMTWRTIDIIQAYTLRWLAEVFFED